MDGHTEGRDVRYTSMVTGFSISEITSLVRCLSSVFVLLFFGIASNGGRIRRSWKRRSLDPWVSSDYESGSSLRMNVHSPKTFFSRGRVLMVCGVSLIAFGIALEFVIAAFVPAARNPWIILVVCGVGARVYLRGKRRAAVSASERLNRDPRPLVLYLRSFAADELAKRGSMADGWLNISGDLMTEEEHLARILGAIGPVVAIGKPGEKLPELGAARFYVADSEWQEAVRTHFDRARLVVLRLGDTEGFWWELKHSLEVLAPAQLLLVVPYESKQYEAFRAKAADRFAHPLPEYVGGGFLSTSSTRGLRSLRGLVYFKPDWAPVFVNLAQVSCPWRFRARFLFRNRLATKLKCGLRPVFEQLEVDWKPPNVSWGGVAILTVLLPFIWPVLLLPELKRGVGRLRDLHIARVLLALSFPFCLLVPFSLWSEVWSGSWRQLGAQITRAIFLLSLAMSIFYVWRFSEILGFRQVTGEATATSRQAGGRPAPPPSASGTEPSSSTSRPAGTAKTETNAVPTAIRLSKGPPFENSLGMRFVPVPRTSALFSIWATRGKDYEVFARETRRKWPKPSFTQTELHPAVNVSWDDAVAFCAWLTERERKAGTIKPSQLYRLPTDDEWSAAVGLTSEEGATPAERSGAVKNRYPWASGHGTWPPPRGAGNFEPALQVDEFESTSPVGSFAPDSNGLFDLGGNVSQWCEDWSDRSRTQRVSRGASWARAGRDGLLSSTRSSDSPTARYEDLGFRVVLGVDLREMANAGSEVAPTALAPTPIPAEALATTPERATKEDPFENSLGLRFVPVPRTTALFSIWHTRVRDYAVFVLETKRAWENPPFAQTERHPVANVSREDAQAFCQWLTARERKVGVIGPAQRYRLPTDEEWSAGVGLPKEDGGNPWLRSESSRSYPWSASGAWPPPPGSGNYGTPVGVDDYNYTSPVGMFRANAYGLFDMGGNLWQWCDDSSGTDEDMCVLRGASWAEVKAHTLRSSYRRFHPSKGRSEDLGFRVVLAAD